MSRIADGSTRASRRESWRYGRRQIAEWIGLPTLVASLPWPLAWRTLRMLARRGRFFEHETASAYSMASSLGFGESRTSWMLSHRLVRIVDQIDPVLSATRGDRWMNRYLAIAGDALPPGPCIFIGFHYGAAFWSLRYLRRNGYRISFLSGPLEASRPYSERLGSAFTRWRQKEVARAGGAPVIYVGGSVERVRAALGQGFSVLALIDVPEPTTSTVPVQVLGHELRFPDGIVRIGASENVPMVGFVAALDPATGVRNLRFTRLPDAQAEAVHALAALLDAAIRDEPAGWHFWAQWPRLRKRVSGA